jgi:hypothetical protein
VPPDPEAGWALPTPSPLVERRYRHREVRGQLLHGQQSILRFHRRILRETAFNTIAHTLSVTLSSPRQSAGCGELPDTVVAGVPGCDGVCTGINTISRGIEMTAE